MFVSPGQCRNVRVEPCVLVDSRSMMCVVVHVSIGTAVWLWWMMMTIRVFLRLVRCVDDDIWLGRNDVDDDESPLWEVVDPVGYINNDVEYPSSLGWDRVDNDLFDIHTPTTQCLGMTNRRSRVDQAIV